MVVPASMLPQKEGPSYSDFHLLLFRGESGILLAGHSHWHNIQYRKARQDAIKNMRNSKLSLEISAAVKGKHFSSVTGHFDQYILCAQTHTHLMFSLFCLFVWLVGCSGRCRSKNEPSTISSSSTGQITQLSKRKN